MSIFELGDIFSNEKAAVDYLIEKGVLAVPIHCGREMRRDTKRPKKYCCRGFPCKSTSFITKGTFFGGTRLAVNKVLFLAWSFLNGSSHTTMIRESHCSSSTVCDWVQFLSELITCDNMDGRREWTKIGGTGHIVEMDESKFGKRKFNRGHRVDGVWIVGGVDITTKEFFAIPVHDRSAHTLTRIISEYVKRGTTIRTDCWRGYQSRKITSLGMVHETVNHSESFVNPITGVHTNTIEGKWNGLKMKIPKQHYKKDWITKDLQVLVWKKRHASDLWGGFIDALKHVNFA